MQGVEEQINTNIVGQLKKLDERIKEMELLELRTEKHESYTKGHFEKLNATQNEHIQLIESLSASLVAFEQATPKNINKILQSELDKFENKIIAELKQATQQFSYKTYEENFKKIETDILDFYKEMMILRDDFDASNVALKGWR